MSYEQPLTMDRGGEGAQRTALLDLGTLESSLQEVLLEFLAGGSRQRMAVSGWHPYPLSRTSSLYGIIHSVPFLKPWAIHLPFIFSGSVDYR